MSLMSTTNSAAASIGTAQHGASACTGIVADGAGFLALTLTASKSFKTAAAAARWLAGKGYRADGSKAVAS